MIFGACLLKEFLNAKPLEVLLSVTHCLFYKLTMIEVSESPALEKNRVVEPGRKNVKTPLLKDSLTMFSSVIISYFAFLLTMSSYTQTDVINKPCETKADCGENLECVDYQEMFLQAGQTDRQFLFCDCEKPMNESTCLCKSGNLIYQRWTKMKARMENPKANGKMKFPQAGFNRAGCYLEEGETCRLTSRDDQNAETYQLCKWGFYCIPVTGTQDWGFCRRSTALRFLPSIVDLSLAFSVSHIIVCLQLRLF
ncbi:unnamed protein product [Allacma fusca]|uniref:Uncharacterized protein n=1 Tax=Allacma fusca TaxID=39272 RepID=A0A8J2P081_9HEXA|nr:unnamed protein product [Allacma fusca]